MQKSSISKKVKVKGLLWCSDGKESACNMGYPGSVPGSGRVPGEENGYPLLYSCLENSMDRGAWQTTRKKKIIYPYSL